MPALKNLHRHAACTGCDAANGARGAAAEVKTTTGNERAAIIDAHRHGAVVGKVGDLNTCTERQGLVRGRQAIGIEGFTIGGRVAALIPTGGGDGGTVRQGGCRLKRGDDRTESGGGEKLPHKIPQRSAKSADGWHLGGGGIGALSAIDDLTSQTMRCAPYNSAR